MRRSAWVLWPIILFNSRAMPFAATKMPRSILRDRAYSRRQSVLDLKMRLPWANKDLESRGSLDRPWHARYFRLRASYRRERGASHHAHAFHRRHPSERAELSIPLI